MVNDYPHGNTNFSNIDNSNNAISAPGNDNITLISTYGTRLCTIVPTMNDKKKKKQNKYTILSRIFFFSFREQ